ncbi:MAG TPA: class I SAM-dependent methyltransferase [Acidimicrobiales bacterium]|nr:class I SAM-dependent methyltransferase [Acidimicrobiales bacterium]
MAETPEKRIDVEATAGKAGGGLAHFFYRSAYRHGRPRWDSAEPHPALRQVIAGRRPGRVLDLGCGTGTDAAFLAAQGWDVVGVDFVPEAIAEAREKTVGGGPPPRFVVGDVTRLRHAGIVGPFDLILDTGCFHGIAAGRRGAYAAEVAAVCAPGADFYLTGISDPPVTWRLLGARGVGPDELRRRFGTDFDLVDERAAPGRGRASHFALYHLVRAATAPDA